MAQDHVKDPERVRTGRLGALTVHSLGRTNTKPARAAWLAKIAAECDPTGELPKAELDRRVQYAIRVRMIRLADARWKRSTAKTTTANEAA